MDREMTLDQFKATVERFIVQADISPTVFGKSFANDPGFVFGLRNGREPREATRARILEAMSTTPTHPESAR